MRLMEKDSPTKRSLPKRLALGFAALASATVVGVAGLAGAAPADKPSKEQCAAAGFTNYGQCVKEWAHNKNKPGNGYGNGNNNEVNTDVNIEVEGNDNVISVFISYVFG